MNSLVSIVVVTYNSSLFVVETLESTLKQTWREIELIITDDCSNDDTVKICREWLKNNKKRFVHSVIITSKCNTGVSANANRGLYAAKGYWINFLAGDDTLKPRCIEDNMLWLASHPEVKVLFSYLEVYQNSFEPQNLIGKSPGDPYNPKSIMARNRSAESQYKMLLVSDRIHYTPSAYLNRDTLISVGGFDERFKLLEDYPLWLNLTKKGHKLSFMDSVTVNYRQHSNAINNTGFSYLINPNYFKSESFRKLCTYPYLPADIRMNAYFYWYGSQIFRFNWLNKNKLLFKILHNLLTVWLNPFKYLIWFRKRFNPELKNNEFYI